MNGESCRMKRIAFCLACVIVLVLAAFSGFASEGGEGAHHAAGAAQLKDFGWRVLNFAVLAAIIGWALGKANVKGALADRQAQIEKNLKDAREAREAAEAKLREYSEKLERATKEIDELHAAIIHEGQLEKERIIAEANRAAAKINSQAALAAEQEVLKARCELQAEAGRLAVELAAGKLAAAVTKGDHDRFVVEYLDKVVQIK